MATRITTIHITVESMDTQVILTAAIGEGWKYIDGKANVAVGDMFAPTYSFEPIDIDNTRHALGERIFAAKFADITAAQHEELNAVIRAGMLVANVTTI